MLHVCLQRPGQQTLHVLRHAACAPAEVDAAYGQREAALEAYRQEEQGRQAVRMIEPKQQRGKARG